MANEIKFLPRRKADQIAFAQQMSDVVTAEGFTPDSIGITAQDVTELGTMLAADKTNHTAINNATATKKSKTQDMNAPGGSHPKLMDKVRYIANTARMSNASDGVLATMGLTRRKASPTRKTAPANPPEITVTSVGYHNVTIRIHETGSAGSRARAANAIGVQIAVVDATNPATSSEADNAPIKSVSHSPVQLDTTGWPSKARLYARWETQRKEVSPWSGPQAVSVL